MHLMHYGSFSGLFIASIASEYKTYQLKESQYLYFKNLKDIKYNQN
jgi:hypothetical protein